MSEYACFDIDGTLSRGPLITRFIDNEHGVGFLQPNAHREILDLVKEYRNGAIDYEAMVQALLTAHANGLRGRNLNDARRLARDFLVPGDASLFRTFSRPVIGLLRDKHPLLAVTAEPRYMALAVAKHLGLHGVRSSEYEIASDGTFTGGIQVNLADSEAKTATLADATIAYAFGDTEGDAAILERARFPYCVNPSPQLGALALQNDWKVYDGDQPQIIADVARTLIK